MALKWDRGRAQGDVFIPAARLWLDKTKTRLISDGDPAAAFLFCVPGRPIPMADAKKYGLLEVEVIVETEPPSEKQPEEASEVTEVSEVKESKPQETKVIEPEATKRKRGRPKK